MDDTVGYNDVSRLNGDCLAGVVGLELGNVAANYPLERPHKFAGMQPNSGDRDHSRLSCAAGEMPLGPRAAGVFSKRCAPMLAIERHRCKAQIAAISSDPKMSRRRPNQQHHCSLCAGL
jgi:hypothetical protein